jgi:tetratricopeptide (TPR) repeat protein
VFSRIIPFILCYAVLWGCNSSEKQAELLYQQGMRDKTHGQFQQALQRFQAAVMYNSQHPNAQAELGMLLCRYGKYADGIKHLLKAHELAPRAFQSASYLGYAYHQRRDWLLAETYYGLAIQLAPNLVDVRQYLADVFEAQGKLEQAAQTLQELLDAYPDYDREAIILARIATLQYPEEPEAYVQLADAHVRHGEDRQGLRAYRQASTLPPNAPELLAQFGIFCAEREQFKTAVTFFEQAVNSGWSNDAEVWWWLAESQDALGNRSAAIEAYQQVLKYQPDYAGIHRRLAEVLEEAERHAEAADVLEKAF